MDILKTTSLLLLLIVFAVLIQFIVERLKVVLGNKVMKYLPADVLAALLGVLFAFMFSIDVFKYFDMNETIPYVGNIISGLIISAGAPAIHEFIANIREQRKLLQDSISTGVELLEKSGGEENE